MNAKIKSLLYSFLACVASGLFAVSVSAQQFTTQVRKFIRIDTATFALTDVTIVDGTGGPVKDHQTILVRNGHIAAVGLTGKVMPPADAQIFNCSGKTIIPGMVMMHEHLFYGEPVAPYYLGMAMPYSFPQLYLAGGVTTMRTAGTVEPQTDINIREFIKEGKLAGPDIDVTGPYIERKGLPIPEVSFITSPQEAARTVNYWADKGCTSFKVYQDITRADLKAVLKAAHRRGIKVTGHLCSITFREAAEAGIDNLEHGFLVSSDFDANKKEDICSGAAQVISLVKLDKNSPAIDSLIGFLIRKKVAITSTLPVFLPYQGREVFPGGADSAVAPQIRDKVNKLYRQMVASDAFSASLLKKEMYWEKEFSDRGGRLMAGIDPTGAGRVIPGYADRMVPELLMEAGFTLPQAIQICSLNAAQYLGKEKEIGTIAVGKRANMVLINGDLRADIKNMRKTEIVFKDAIGWDAQKIFDSVKGLVGLY